MSRYATPLLTLLILAFSAAPLGGCDSTANLTEQEHIQRAKDFEDKGQLKGSIVELKNAIQKNPDSPQARLLLGQVYLKAGMGAEAEKELLQAEKLGVSQETIKPQLGEALLLMGEYKRVLDEIQPGEQTAKANLARIWQLRADALLKLDQLKDACNLYQQSLDADKNNPSTYKGLAQCAIAENNIPKAKEWLDAALKIDPKFTEALYLKAALLESESKPDEAAKVYQQILVLVPTQFRAHLSIASLQLKKGDMEAADKSIQAAENLAGNVPMVKYARGTLELQRGKLEKASASFLEVLRVAPSHLPSMLAYAMSSFGLGHYEQSINYAGKVLGEVPKNLIATEILAGSLLKTGDVSGAIKTLTPLLPYYPNDAKLMALAGEAYLRANDYNKAMSYLDRASALDPKSAAIKTRLAAGHLAGGENDKALADLEAAASLDTKSSQADLSLVMMLLKDKEYDKAFQAIANLEKKLPDNPITHNLRAAALLGKQDRAGARKQLEQALAIEPKFFLAAFNLARLDLVDKKPEVARKRFETILAADKNNVQAMLALADLAAKENREKDSMDWLEKAVKADPTSILANKALILTLLSKKENAKALAQARQASNANSESLDALNLLGTAQLSSGDNNASIKTYSRIVQKAPQSPEAYLNLAIAQIANKQLATARNTLKKAIQLQPNHVQSLDALLRLELLDNKPEAALKAAQAIQTAQPTSPLGFDREADIYSSQKRLPQAIKLYEIALGKGATNMTVIKLQRVLRLAGDVNNADKQLANWINQHPQDSAVRDFSAQMNLAQGRNREAIAQYQEVLKLAPNSVVALNNLATLYQKEKDSRAMATAEQALKLAPDNPGVQDTLGWILVEQGQLPRAVELLRKAAAKAPKDAGVRYHYGVVLARSGYKKEAKNEIEAAIATGQKFPELDEAKALLKSL